MPDTMNMCQAFLSLINQSIFVLTILCYRIGKLGFDLISYSAEVIHYSLLISNCF